MCRRVPIIFDHPIENVDSNRNCNNSRQLRLYINWILWTNSRTAIRTRITLNENVNKPSLAIYSLHGDSHVIRFGCSKWRRSSTILSKYVIYHPFLCCILRFVNTVVKQNILVICICTCIKHLNNNLLQWRSHEI